MTRRFGLGDRGCLLDCTILSEWNPAGVPTFFQPKIMALMLIHGERTMHQNLAHWLAFGTAAGVSIGVCLQNMALGIAIGLAAGLIGSTSDPTRGAMH